MNQNKVPFVHSLFVFPPHLKKNMKFRQINFKNIATVYNAIFHIRNNTKSSCCCLFLLMCDSDVESMKEIQAWFKKETVTVMKGSPVFNLWSVWWLIISDLECNRRIASPCPGQHYLNSVNSIFSMNLNTIIESSLPIPSGWMMSQWNTATHWDWYHSQTWTFIINIQRSTKLLELLSCFLVASNNIKLPGNCISRGGEILVADGEKCHRQFFLLLVRG